jgi:hypothetical protein
MEYRAVGNRCAVNLKQLHLPLTAGEALQILNRLGFLRVEVDIVALARSRIGVSRYRRGARASEAPETVDCSSLIKWLCGQKGLWLPRRTIQQMAWGMPVEFRSITSGDLVFISGRINYFHDDPSAGVGHVGIVTGNGTVIHAANSVEGVVESGLNDFVAGDSLRGIRRLFNSQTLTLATPANREVEVADDLRWIVLQQLKNA